MSTQMTGSDRLPVAVFGAGHMGKHHVRLYSQMSSVRVAAVIDTNVERARELATPIDAAFGSMLTPEMGDIAAATIAVPTIHHLHVARPLIERGIGVLIEKPIAATVAEAEEIADLGRKRGAIVAVGHTERFNPAVRAVERLGIRPRYVETQRVSPFTFRSADIGVVFDMMIHDIDVTLSMIREPVARVDAVGVAVLGPHEDVCNARITFEGGAVAGLTASRLALKTDRRLRAFAENAYVSLDYQKKAGIAVTRDRNLDILKLARERNLTDLSQMAGLDFGKMVHVEPLQIESGDALATEIAAFVEAVRTRTSPPVGADDGVAAVRVATAIVAAVAEHRWETSAPTATRT